MEVRCVPWIHLRWWVSFPEVTATSNARLKARDQCNLRALIGRKGGNRPGSLHTRRWKPKGPKKILWMKSLHGVLHGGLSMRCHGFMVRRKNNPKSFWIFVVLVVHQRWPSHILSMASIERTYVLRTLSVTWGKRNKMSPLGTRSKDPHKTNLSSVFWNQICFIHLSICRVHLLLSKYMVPIWPEECIVQTL